MMHCGRSVMVRSMETPGILEIPGTLEMRWYFGKRRAGRSLPVFIGGVGSQAFSHDLGGWGVALLIMNIIFLVSEKRLPL
jgi:hypothetical protein